MVSRRAIPIVVAFSCLALACKTEVVDERAKEEATAEVAPAEVRCRGAAELEAGTHATVEGVARQTYQDLRAGRAEEIWNGLHPLARRDDQKKAFFAALQSMQSRLQSADAAPTTMALHVVEVAGKTEEQARVPCPGSESAESFTFVTSLTGEDLAVVTLLTPAGAFGLATTLQLRMSGDAWRLVGIQVNPTSYKGRDAVGWELVADTYWRADKPMPSYFALGVAQTLSTRGGSIHTASKDRINEKLEDVRKDAGFAEDTTQWTVGEQTYELAGVALASTQSDISPVIKYVSPEGTEREVLDRHADVLAAHLRRLHPELTELFDAVVFEAYAEAPTDTSKTYEGFRLVRPLTQ